MLSWTSPMFTFATIKSELFWALFVRNKLQSYMESARLLPDLKIAWRILEILRAFVQRVECVNLQLFCTQTCFFVMFWENWIFNNNLRKKQHLQLYMYNFFDTGDLFTRHQQSICIFCLQDQFYRNLSKSIKLTINSSKQNEKLLCYSKFAPCF